jgi:signal transduction histidine kinase
MKSPLASRTLLLLLATCLILSSAWLAWYQLRFSGRYPNQKFVITPDSLKEWTSYDGTWNVLNGAIHNDSAERGPKLMAGSPHWTDYTLTADMRFDGNHGDMGVIIRSSDEEAGVDAYRGYYAGLRTTDGMAVVGRADHGWLEARPVRMPGGIGYGTWYRITFSSYHCTLAATTENLSTHQAAYVVFEEHPCLTSGRIGLRSFATGGSWRNISVAPASEQDIERVRQHVDSISHPDYPVHEAAYNLLQPLVPDARPSSVQSAAAQPDQAPTHIGDLLNLQAKPDGEVALRGVVTLTHPDLYIQDPTGGILVESPASLHLNTGDVVEVHGRVSNGLYSATIHASTMRLLWNGTPASPISVTPAQAASGSYDARYIEIEGRLTGDIRSKDAARILTFTDGIQTFNAIDARSAEEPARQLETGSTLRVRGVCVLGRSYTREQTPFVVLLPSSSYIELVADPPWWNPWHETMLFAGVLIAALLSQVTYFRFRRWKADTITRERERLAHDIHDTMAQGFAGVGYQIQGIHKTVAASSAIDRNYVTEQLRVAYQLVHRCHEEASRTIAMMAPQAPPTPDKLLASLADAARRIAGNVISVSTEAEGLPPALPLRMVNALLHIGREAVVNAAAHGAPSEITIILRAAEGMVELAVRDDGRGFLYTPERAGFGILGMQKRVRDIAGTLTIHSTPGVGTEVLVAARIPEASVWQRLRTAFALRRKTRPTPPAN